MKPSTLIRHQYRLAGRQRRRVLFVTLAVAFSTVPLSAQSALATVPTGFEDVVVVDVNGPTDLAWTPDGRMLVTAKNGQLWIIENGVLVPTPAIDLAATMCTNGERALGAVAVHPEFANNNYVYLYYTFNKNGTCNESETDGPVNRLSRFELVGNTIDPASETVLFDTPPLYRDHHNGGDIIFASDGFLYVTVGDGGTRSLDRPQDPGYLLGKIVRLTDSGAIPPGNAFTGASSARCNVDGVPPTGSAPGTECQEIFASGLRNPFRFAADPNSATPRFYINDVGQSSFEEISELTAAGTDFGWPLREGPCVFDATTDCGPPPAGLTDPIHWYPHGVDGGAATAGVFVPNGVWPAEYDGSYLFADYVFGNIYQLVANAGEDRTVNPPTSGFDAVVWADIPSVVSMAFGPHNGGQALYYVTREGDGVHRIDFVGSANRAPVAVASADVTSGPVPLAVQFDGTGSTDPDGDTLSYSWDFDGDGIPDSSSPSPSHTYTEAGTVFATLTVDDGAGSTAIDSLRIDPGNSAPIPVIATPTDGSTFFVGQTITLSGGATDVDEILDDSALTWEVLQHHAEHNHPFLDATGGNNIDIVTPEPEDLLSATNSYLEILLTATDSAGLSTTISRIVQPQKVNLTFDSAPAGLGLTLDGTTVTTPSTVVSWVNHSLAVEAANQTDSSGAQWDWESWSDGGAQSHVVLVAGEASYSASFSEGVADTLSFSPTDDATIRADKPDSARGLDVVIEADASPIKDSLIRFDIAGLAGRGVSSATLRMFVTNSSPNGGAVALVSDNTWTEASVTWNTAPAADGATVAQIGDIDLGTWIDIDVTAGVSSDGPVSFRISSDSINGADYSSLQDPAGNLPELVVIAGDPPGEDTEPPTPPANLVATPDTPTEIELDWTPSVDNVGVVGYNIHRCDGPPSIFGIPCDDLLIQVGNVLLYEDLTVVPSSTYTYEVRARDAAGNVSTESNAASATTPGPDSTPPSAPSNLLAAVTNATLVDLTWTAAVDDTELAGYSIYRNGAVLAEVGDQETTYADTDTAPDATYSYWVVAFDSSGNVSVASNTASVTMPPAPSILVIPVAEDASIRDGRRGDRNYGDDVEVEADGRPVKDGLIQFAVPDLAGQTIQSATIRVFVVNSSSSGGTFSLVDNAWDEDTVTWNTAPSPGVVVGSIGDVDKGVWMELDVTTVVTGAGDISFRFSSPNTNGVAYQSKEGGVNGAQLVLEFG